MDIRRIYEYALQREKEGYRFFSENARKANHASVISIFERLAKEELEHIKFIERLLGQLDHGESIASVTVEVGLLTKDGWFEQRAESEMIEQTVIESMVPDLPILRMAYLIEQDLAEFYHQAAMRCEGDERKALEMLSMWEKGHEQLFKSLHDKAFESYIQMPWGG